MIKPPYCLPSMAEIATLPRCGLTVASTFSGCGGSSLGYRMAGFDVVWANEFVSAARDSYRANWPTTTIDPRDVRAVRGSSIVAATGIPVGKLDVLDGSPPCASFSTAGQLEAQWGAVKTYSDTKQRVDDLFFEYARLVHELQPRVFVAENVAGLVQGVAKGMFKRLLAHFVALGYNVEARLLDAQWLGVPQVRKRLIFVGVRRDLARAPVFPTPLPYRYSVRDALPELNAVQDGVIHDRWLDAAGPSPPIVATRAVDAIVTSNAREAARLHAIDRPAPTVRAKMSGTGGHSDYQFASGASSGVVEWVQTKHDRRSLDTPAPTVLTLGRRFTHNEITLGVERRRLTIAEVKRICGFPDDFVLTGSYGQQWERLGRAVPPPMMAAIARAIRDGVLLRAEQASA